jgi:GNAT superfamily N-acetyltransferase
MIDTANDRDIPALADMLRGLNANHAFHLPDRFHDRASPAELQAHLRGQMDLGAQLLVYRLQDVPRGYLMWRWRAAGDPALEHPRRVAVLDHIYVEPNFRRHGMARRLVARFEAEIARSGGSGWVALVHRFNVRSAALMRGAGAAQSVDLFEKRLQAPQASSNPATIPR